MKQYLTALDCSAKARTTLNQWYAWVRLGDAPKAAMRGYWEPDVIAEWLEDRAKGVPLPVSGKKPRAWRKEAMSHVKTYDRETTKALCKVRSDSMFDRLTRRGDIPKSVFPGHWRQSEIDSWVADREQGKPLPWSNSILPAWDLEKGGYYMLSELPALLKVSVATIAVYERRGDFPQRLPFPYRGKFPKGAVDAWLEDRKAGRALPSGHYPTQWDPLGPAGSAKPQYRGLKPYQGKNPEDRPQSAAYFDALPIDEWVPQLEATRILLARQEWAQLHSSIPLDEFTHTYVIPISKIREHYGEKRADEYMAYLSEQALQSQLQSPYDMTEEGETEEEYQASLGASKPPQPPTSIRQQLQPAQPAQRRNTAGAGSIKPEDFGLDD